MVAGAGLASLNASNKKDILLSNSNSHFHFVNITGFSGNTYFDPLPVYNISLRLTSEWKPKKAYLLSGKKAISFKYGSGYVSATLPALDEFESIVLEK